jgi:NADH-quinone oxidoreductase subunit J
MFLAGNPFTPHATAMPEAVLFWILAPLTVLAALSMLFVRKAVHSALLLAFVMIGLAVFYIAEGAPFLGIVQIVVYTGAVMMLFLFILMLVGVDSTESLVETIKGQRIAALAGALGLVILLVGAIGRAYTSFVGISDVLVQNSIVSLAELLFTRYVWAFEVVSALLITAALGAMVLAHRERTTPRPTQKDLAIARFRPGSNLPGSTLPNPGVYALHNAVDVPALRPDGTPEPTSVSELLQSRGDIQDMREFRVKPKVEE